MIYFDRHQFRRLSLAVAENDFFHCSPVFTGCTWYCTRKTNEYEGCWHNKTFFCNFLVWRGEFYFDVVGNLEPKKITPNCNALAKSIISYLWVSYFPFFDSVKPCYLQTKKHAVTSLERAHSITWSKQTRRRNRWASKQVSWRLLNRSMGEKILHFQANSNQKLPKRNVWFKVHVQYHVWMYVRRYLLGACMFHRYTYVGRCVRAYMCACA